MTALVSVCIPTYNGARYVRECIESALCQTFGDIEILVVDDASTDETVATVQEYARRDARIRVFCNQFNLGLVTNWNRCIELASGSWLKFLFQDDFIRPDCIQRMLDVRREDFPLIVCRREMIFEADVSDPVRDMYLEFTSEHHISHRFPNMSVITAEQFCEEFLHHATLNWIGEPTATLIHRSAFERFGLFNPALVSLCDWEFFSRVSVNTGLCYLDYTGAAFRVHERSASALYRSNSLYRAKYIDPLIIRHDIAYAPAYAPVRILASQKVPPVNLIRKLLYKALDVRLLAEDYAYDPVDPDGALLREWEQAVRKYPRFRSVPMSYIVSWSKRKAKAWVRKIGWLSNS